MFDLDKFAELLKKAIGDRTSVDYADLVDVNRTYISKLMNKKLSNPPSPDIIKRLASKAYHNITYQDLMIAAGYSEEQKKIDLLDALEDQNTKIYAGNQPLTPKQRIGIIKVIERPDYVDITKSTLPLLGSIRAGTPLLADGNYEGELEIPADIEADFALRIEGDSMIGVGIHEGDYAICREGQMPNSGQITVALRDLATGFCEATLKFYFKENGGAVLRAANPDFEDIPAEKGWRTSGVLVALLKKEPPIYKIYNSYLAARDINMDKWVPVLEKAFQAGLKPEQVEAVIDVMRKVK